MLRIHVELGEAADQRSLEACLDAKNRADQLSHLALRRCALVYDVENRYWPSHGLVVPVVLAGRIPSCYRPKRTHDVIDVYRVCPEVLGPEEFHLLVLSFVDARHAKRCRDPLGGVWSVDVGETNNGEVQTGKRRA
ncbi:hypothetical protein N8I77_004102 [Diaporthe amygdali]|uniref:Uncharacterized protein n=1 Tax=Phomopsis amygdali TaxID=1214568 RepID=A0AAD9SMR1_PHOAM|nr:hypothetical protein N8I77_004102 [Diaporthe amygdali]